MAEVKELVEEVWVEGSQMEGDIIVHEYGNNSTRTGVRGKQLPRWRHTPISKKRRRGGEQTTIDIYASDRPDGASEPVLVHVWVESLTSWGTRAQMLGSKSSILRKHAQSD